MESFTAAEFVGLAPSPTARRRRRAGWEALDRRVGRSTGAADTERWAHKVPMKLLLFIIFLGLTPLTIASTLPSDTDCTHGQPAFLATHALPFCVATTASTWWPSDVQGWIALVGGIVGLVGGVTGIVSAFRPPKISVAHMDHIGIVVSRDPHTNQGSTQKVHLPLVLSNLAKKPGVVTSMALAMRECGRKEWRRYNWSLFWTETPDGQRSRERGPSAIPIPGYACVERNIQFDAEQPIRWEPQLYEFRLLVWVGRGRRLRQVSTFYARPDKKRCDGWYGIQTSIGPMVDDLPTFLERSDVPKAGS